MYFYDWHTHLNDNKLYPDFMKYVNNFVDQWWRWLVNIWVTDWRNERWIELVETIKQWKVKERKELYVGTTIWYHPEHVEDWSITQPEFNNKINRLIKLHQEFWEHIVAIWESWIDIHYPWGTETLDIQKEFFAMQLDLAQHLNLPIVIHSRDDFYSTFDVLKNYKNLKVYFHCWGYGREELKIAQDFFPNLWIWFAWNVTYPKAQLIREGLDIIDLDKIIIETDAPYLAPQAIRWTMNEPINVKYIYEYFSEYYNIPLIQLCEKFESNFKKLYI